MSWCWQRGVQCPESVADFLTMVSADKVPAPDTVTVKLDGKYWRVMSADMGARRQGISRVNQFASFVGAF